MRKSKQLAISFIFIVCLTVINFPVLAKQDILIGGGSVTGVYYQVAAQTCKLMNKNKGDAYNCIGRPAMGSVFNINAVIRGLLDFGITQSDVNYAATMGEGPWKGKPVTQLRSVFSMHPETVLLMTRAETGIRSISDLKGKVVNIGNLGSGQRGNALDILRLHGIDEKTDLKTEGLQQSEASQALVDKRIDAFFYTVGNPSTALSEPANAIQADLIDINSKAIKKMVAEKPYYVMTTIPANTYNGINHSIETYAVKATVVASSSLSQKAVYDYVKTVFEHLEELKGMHAAFKILNPKDMLDGLTAPLHDGAIKYYKERGLI